ncbi:hypothetical protein NCCP2648_06190 [Lacticaseibacillus rhamnosus]|nr:hypothetical protein NCCP2648_06190 [Lacticaseibacillus rhamnosus]
MLSLNNDIDNLLMWRLLFVLTFKSLNVLKHTSSFFVKYTDVTMTLSAAQLSDQVGLDLPNG